MKKVFLPAGLVVAVAAALLLPGPGVWAQDAGAIPLLVVVIFLVNGWEFRSGEGRVGAVFFRAFAVAAGLSLLAGPWIGRLASLGFGLAPETGAGLVVMAAVPVTLSSAIVIAEIGGGNRAWALFLTILLNLAGIFTVPVLLKLVLEGAGPVEISTGRLLLQLMGLVLAPFVAGALARRKLPGLRSGAWLGYLPSLCVILTVYCAFASARGTLVHTPAWEYLPLSGAAFTVHAALMLLAWAAARLLGLERPERVTMLFVVSQKTLPLAITVVALILPGAALALIPCLLYHFIQLFLDSWMAARLRG